MGRKKKNVSYSKDSSTETIFHFEPKNQSQQEVVKNYASKDLLFLITLEIFVCGYTNFSQKKKIIK